MTKHQKVGGPTPAQHTMPVWERYRDAPMDEDNQSLYEGWLVGELRLPKCLDCGTLARPAPVDLPVLLVVRPRPGQTQRPRRDLSVDDAAPGASHGGALAIPTQ